MPRNSKITTLAIAATIAVVLIVPLSTIAASSTGTQTVTNETVVADNQFHDLRGYSINNGSVTVTNTSGGTVDSAHYSVRYDTGEIKIDGTNATALSSGDNAEVDYTYQATDATTAVVAGIVPLLALLFVLVKISNPIQSMMG